MDLHFLLSDQMSRPYFLPPLLSSSLKFENFQCLMYNASATFDVWSLVCSRIFLTIELVLMSCKQSTNTLIPRFFIMLLVYAFAENHAFGFWLGHKWNEYYVACQVGNAIYWNCTDCYQQHSHKGWCMWSSFLNLLHINCFLPQNVSACLVYSVSIIYLKGISDHANYYVIIC